VIPLCGAAVYCLRRVDCVILFPGQYTADVSDGIDCCTKALCFVDDECCVTVSSAIGGSP
jgi:hypothetical protein